MPDQPAVTAAFLVYLAVMLSLGVLGWRYTQTLSDYLLGGRRLGPVVTALSAGASDMSGWLLLGLPGFAYVSGLGAGWLALGLFVGAALNWFLVAKPLRMETARLGDALTLPDYFEARFEDKTHLLRIISATMILLFFVFYTASGLVAGGKLFNSVFGLSYEWAVLAGATVVVLYTLLGGFLAVSWTDAVQAVLILLALLLAASMGLSASDYSQLENPQLLNPMTYVDGSDISLMGTVSLLAWGLGYFGQPHILARFMAIKSIEALPVARFVGIGWTLVTLVCALFVGFSGWFLLDPELVNQDPERVFILLVDGLFTPIIAGLALAAILAAIMSTADSQLLVASSAITEDFYKQLIRPNASVKETLWVGRLAVVLVAVIAVGFALSPESKVLDLVAYAWAGFGAAFGPVVLMSLYWRDIDRNGALAGIVVGGATVIIWEPLQGGVFDVYEIVPGIVFSVIAILIVSGAGGVIRERKG